MNDRDMWWKILLVGAICALGVFATFPLDQKLKFGIDLDGGYSLLYEIDDSGLDASQRSDLAERVMKVLQERVDPDGVMNLVWRPIGSNRLEIQMPRASDEVMKFRQEYDRLKDELKATNLRRGEIVTALARPAAERDAALSALVRGVSARSAMLKELSKLSDDLAAAKAAKQNDTLYDLEDKYDRKIDEVLATNVDPGRLQAVLDAGAKSPFRVDELKKMSAVAPEHAELLNKIVDSHDQWRRKRGRAGTLDDPADLQRLLRGAGVLEFRMLAEVDSAEPTKYDGYRENLRRYGSRPRPGEESLQWFEIEKPAEFFKHIPDFEKNFEQRKLSERLIVDKYGEKYYALAYVTPNKSMTQQAGEVEWTLKGARSDRDQEGKPAVAFQLDERGGVRFGRLTSENKGKFMCIFLDDRAVSYATIEAVIHTSGIIHGSFTPQDVQELVKKLNAGSLPRKLKEPPISVRAIGPSLGEANRQAGMRSAIYGGIAVVVVMVVFYFYAGMVAVIATAINLLLTLGTLALLGATLTLPGVAGLVLSVGMAVDANILINERIREELAKGVNLRMAVRLGYERAFSAILDSNLTTFITSAILYWIASEEIKGFGLTLGAGVVINLFTAVFATRIFFEFMTLARVPAAMIRLPLISAAIPGAIGAAIWGAGRALLSPESRETSLSMAFGELLIFVGVGVAVYYAMMWGLRLVHQPIGGAGHGKLPMMPALRAPNIDWYSKRRMFYIFTVVVTVGGLLIFEARGANDIYDIEFLGGTAAQVDIKAGVTTSEKELAARLTKASAEMREMADKLASAQIATRGSLFTLQSPGVPAARLGDFLRPVMGDWLAPNGLRETGAETVELQTKADLNVTVDGKAGAEEEATRLGIKGGLAQVADRVRKWADDLSDAQIQSVLQVGAAKSEQASFEIVSRVTSKEVVVDALLASMGDLVDISPALSFELRKNERMNGAEFFAVTDKDLSVVTGDPKLVADVSDFRGGVAMVLDNLQPPQSADSLAKRIKAMRLQPGFERYGWRDSAVIPLAHAPGGDLCTKAVVLASDENFVFDEGGETAATWRENLAEPEAKLAREALERQTSLSKITQFAPQVASEAKTKAYAALAVSWLAIILYVWIRFGSATWGGAAVLALIHDVAVALGMVAISHFLSETFIGRALLIEGFRIDLSMVAALLTVVGYSVNDKIVVFDRMRENLGRQTLVTPTLMNQSINQTLSRTLLTGLTVLITILIMYTTGGRGVHGFMYAMFIGLVVGTFSSIYVASPMLIYLQNRSGAAKRPTLQPVTG